MWFENETLNSVAFIRLCFLPRQFVVWDLKKLIFVPEF